MSVFKRPYDGEYVLPAAKRKRNTMLSQILRNGKWSDFRISCRTCDFDVHRVVLMGHSTFLDRVMDDTFQEGINQRLDLPELKPTSVDTVLCWIYEPDNFDIDDYVTGERWTRSISRWTQLIDTHFLAGLWQIPVLEKLLEEQLRRKLNKYYFDIDKIPSDQLMRHFADVLRYVFTTEEVSRRMKKLFAWIIAQMNNLVQPLQTDDQVDDLIRAYPDLTPFLYRHYRRFNRLQPACHLCATPFHNGLEPRYIPINEWMTDHYELIWMACACAFQGVDATDCKAQKRNFLNVDTYCRTCHDNHVDIPDAVEGAVEEVLYLIDGELIVEAPAANSP